MGLAPPTPKCAKCQSNLEDLGVHVIARTDTPDPAKAAKVRLMVCSKGSCSHMEMFRAG